MKDKKIIFMGTPQFSIPVLEKLIENCNVIAVVTQPDSYVGRKKVLTESPVKQLAKRLEIKVFQPERIRNDYQEIIDMKPDMIVTCAYGQIIPEKLLEAPKYKTINVHASILPKLRGGAPIARAIMEGYEETGITIMQTDKGMDSGDVITSKSIIIEDSDNQESLSDKLKFLGAELLIETLPSIFDNSCKYLKQDETEVTFAPIITKEDEYLDFNKTARQLFNQVRGLYPEPATYAMLDGERIKIYEVEIGNNVCGENGEIVEIYKNGIGVSTKDGEIIIKKLQIPGKSVINASDYLNGKNKDSLLGKIFK